MKSVSNKSIRFDIFLLFLMIFLFTVFSSYAQENHNFSTSFNIGLSSPNAASLSKFGQIPVNFSRGTPNISIPLDTAESRGLGFPIQLKYHASGIRVNEIAGWVGLGWALDAGGAVTRSVMRGLPDETADGYLNKGDQTRQFATHSMTDEQEQEYLKKVNLGVWEQNSSMDWAAWSKASRREATARLSALWNMTHREENGAAGSRMPTPEQAHTTPAFPPRPKPIMAILRRTASSATRTVR